MIHLSKPTDARGWMGHWEYDVSYSQDMDTPTQAFCYFSSTDDTDSDPVVDFGTDVCVDLDFSAPVADLESNIAAQLIAGFPEWKNATSTIS